MTSEENQEDVEHKWLRERMDVTSDKKREDWLIAKDLENISKAMDGIHYLERYFGKKLYDMKILDVGCGKGHFTNLLQYCGVDCTGLDALSNFEDKKINSDKTYFMNGNIFWLPFENGHFDLVHENMVFSDIEEIQHHMSEFAIPAVMEIVRVIKPNGYYYGDFPDKFYGNDMHKNYFSLVNTHLAMEFALWQKKL